MLSFHDQTRRRVDAWITRRFLIQLVPRLNNWIEKKISIESATSTHQSRERLHFDHDVAQLKIPLKAANPKESNSSELIFVVAGMKISSDNKKIALTLTNRAAVAVVALNISSDELHKILGQLLHLAKKADWNIANPFRPAGEKRPLQSQPRALH